MVVDIALSRDQDNPQLIFESMDPRQGADQADLIRNFILMGLEPNLQTRLYEDYWRPMERLRGRTTAPSFDSFMRHYLTVRTATSRASAKGPEAFKDYSRTTPVRDAGIEALVKEIRGFAAYFCALALGTNGTPHSVSLHDLRELKVMSRTRSYWNSTTTPAARSASPTSRPHCRAYVFRRAICMIPTNSKLATSRGAEEGSATSRGVQAHFLARSILQENLPRRRVPPRPAHARSLQLRSRRPLAAPPSRITAGRSVCRWTSTPSTSPPRNPPICQWRGGRRSARSGAGDAYTSSGCTRSAT